MQLFQIVKLQFARYWIYYTVHEKGKLSLVIRRSLVGWIEYGVEQEYNQEKKDWYSSEKHIE